MVAAGQVHVRPEHVGFKRQAAVFSAAYLRARGPCDAFDAGMGALTVLVETKPRRSRFAVVSMPFPWREGSGWRHGSRW